MTASGRATDLATLSFGDEDAILLPLEQLSPEGMSDAFFEQLAARGRGQLRELFDAAFSRVFRAEERLAREAPDTFPPPKLSNLVLLTGVDRVHPYFRPFPEVSLVLYAADFDARTSSVQHAAFQLLWAERLAQTGRAGFAALETLPYLFSLDEPDRTDFMAGCERSRRPDRAIALRVARALTELGEHLRCDGVHVTEPPPEGFARVKNAPILIHRSAAPLVQALVTELDQATKVVVDQHFARQAVRSGDERLKTLCNFLAEERPRLLVLGDDAKVLWDPDWPREVGALRQRLASVGDRPLESVLADLRCVGETTEIFFRGVLGARRFHIHSDALEAAGGLFIHQDRSLLAYALTQPGLDTTREQAPPFHRLLLAARAMHEWGHVAVESGVVPVPPDKATEFEQAHTHLAEVFDQIVASVPAEFRETVDRELEAMQREGTRLSDLPFSRMEDYRSNLLMRRLLPPEPLQAYVRTNVRSLAKERIGPLRKLARYAYEVQYLFLAGFADPVAYLLSGTFFGEEYLASGLVSEAHARAVIDAVGRLARCFEVDETRLVAS